MSQKKRSDQRAGHRTKAEQQLTDHVEAKAVQVPPKAQSWHPVAKRLWDGLKASPQNQYYTQADWEYAYYTMGAVSETINSGYSAMKLSAVNDMLKQLLVTEPERRRVNIEVARTVVDTAAEDAKVKRMADYRQQAAAGDT